ncbi:MAG TPA: hypothetical protein PKA12_13615 [Saprospiraceae bacterium]|nr:hypothetical protein [Saprospiraceae bacterium]
MKFIDALQKTRNVVVGVLFVFVFKLALYSQDFDNTAILVKPHNKSNSLMINRQGKIVREFEMNELVKVVENEKDNFLSMLYLIDYASHDFNMGPLAVSANKEWTLYDITGKRLTTIDKKYSYLGYANGGLLLATKINETNPKKFTSVFLNASGNEVFDGKKLWNASSFNGNFALAKEEDDKGAWIVLNKRLMTYSALPAPLSERIESVSRVIEPYFVIYQNKKYGWGEILADSLGTIIFDASVHTGIQNMKFKALKGSLCIYTYKNSHYFFKDLKNQIIPDINITSVDGLSDRLIFINKLSSKENLFDHQFHPVHLPQKTNEVFKAIKLEDHYLIGYVLDTLTHKMEYRAYDANTLQLLSSSDKKFEDIIADEWVGVDPRETFKKKLTELYNFNNGSIFKMPTSHQMFKGIASTKGYAPAEIHHLEVMYNEDLSKLNQFKNLRSLEFFDFKFTSLPPVIKKLKSLNALDLRLCKHLTTLPTWLSDLKSLKFIDIHDCKNLRNIEPVLLKLPQLKEVTTMNYDFDDNFLLRMQKPGAKFQVNNIYGTPLDEGPVIEESDR